MKVAVIVSTYPPYRGGMGNLARDHAEALARAGHDVTVMAPVRSCEIGETDLKCLLLRPFLRYGNAAWAPQLLWRLIGFDAVELHYPFFGGAEAVWLWKRLFGRRKRLTVVYHMDAVGRGFARIVFSWHRRLFLKRILAAADHIVCTSRDYLASSQAGMFANDARLTEIPPGVDTRRFAPVIARAPRSAVFVGGLDRAHYFKGVEILLEAFQSVTAGFPDARLFIVGDGDLRPRYERRAVALGLGDKVRFLGRLGDAEKIEAYRSASFHVLPSIDRSEAFGMVTQEAAVSGLASVVSDLPGVRTTVEEGKTGLIVPPGDAARLAEAMRRLFADPEATGRLGAAARERAVRLYASDRVGRLIVDTVVGT
jgi:glycosyltransferase involved in cell wall biosynthesis